MEAIDADQAGAMPAADGVDADAEALGGVRDGDAGVGDVDGLAVLFAIKGTTERAFYRWIDGNWRHLFPHLPERTRLFRLFATHANWTDRFLASPTLFGVADTFGVELIHPGREGRSKRQIGRKGLSNKRWIVGGKLGFVRNCFGRVCAWRCDTANVHDKHFRSIIEPFDQRMIVLTDNGFHGESGDPPPARIASASRSFATICSGPCRFRFLLSDIESLVAHPGRWDPHNRWIRIWGAGHRCSRRSPAR